MGELQTEPEVIVYNGLVESMGKQLRKPVATPAERREVDQYLRKATQGLHPRETMKAAHAIVNEKNPQQRVLIGLKTVVLVLHGLRR